MARPDTPPSADAPPRRPLLWAALISALATLTVAWPALTGGFLVNPHSDQYIAGFAFREFAARSLASGEGFPLWNPYLFGGMPYVAAMHGDIFYPTFLLRMVLPTDIAMTWGFVLHMMLAGFFTFGFLRATGVRFHAALIGGVAYLLAGPIASYASPGHDGKLFVSTLLPAALWALVSGIRGGSRAAWGILAIIVGLAVLSPHPQLLQYMLLVMGAYALWLALVKDHSAPAVASASKPASAPVGNDAPATQSRARMMRLLYAAGAVLLGGAMGAIQYLPLSEYTPWSPRSGGKGWEHATSYSFPLEETINTYLPQFSGILDRYWGVNNIHFHSEYLGAAVLVLALLGIGGGLANRHRRHGWFWLAAFVGSLLWAWGGNTPFFHIIYNLVPGTKYFRAPSTILYVVSFSVAFLAAFGAERALARRVSMRYIIGWAAFALIVAVMASVGGFTNLAIGIRGEAADWIMQNANAVVIGAWRSALFVLAMCAVLFLLIRDRLRVNVAAWLILGLVTVDLWSIARHYWMFSERADRLFASDPIIEYIKAQPQPARVLPLRFGNSDPRDPFIRGDAFMHVGVRNTLGYHGNELGRYQQLYGHSEGGREIVNPNFWTLTNTRYLYTDIPEIPFEGARLVAGPVRNSVGTMAYLYELPGDHPPAWVAPLMVKLDDATTRATLLDPRFDVRRVAIFDTAAPVAARPVDTPIPEPAGVRALVTRYDPGAIDIRLEGVPPSGSALVVSENYYPGWTATVNGQAAAIGRADLVLIGVELPDGAREIQLRFDSAPYHTGKTITLIALVLATLAAIAGLVLDGRARRRSPVDA
jgi:hypothetical protein